MAGVDILATAFNGANAAFISEQYARWLDNPGSVDVSFGPTKPAGASNWIQTIPGQGWFAYFRFYGPTEPYFSKTWQLNDIERIQP